MQVELAEALRAYEELPPERRAPGLHPFYLLADAEREEGLRPIFWVHRGAGNLMYHAFHLAPLPAGLSGLGAPGDGGGAWFDLQSPYGYGGAVLAAEDEGFAREGWACYLEWARAQRVLVEFIRFHPLLGNEGGYGGEVLRERETVWIGLGAEDLLGGYSGRARTAIRKALKEGAAVRQVGAGEFLERFVPLYEARMRAVGAAGGYLFPLAYHRALVEGVAGRALLLLCEGQGGLLGGAIFLMERPYLEYHLAAATPEGNRLGAPSLLIHEAALRGRAAGCQRLHLGGGTDARPENALLFFKASFSAARAEFRIGRFIHQEAPYRALREAWEGERGKPAQRVLFYRF